MQEKRSEADRKQEAAQATAVHSGSCRCEEVSKMTPRQLLGLMLSDMAFWKRPEKKMSGTSETDNE